MEKIKLYTSFGEHLRALRENAGLTLKEVASAMHIDSSLLGKIERNQRPPKRLLISNLASFFNVCEKELLTEFLSDQIAYKILGEEGDLNILKVAERKVSYLKTLHNGKDWDKK